MSNIHVAFLDMFHPGIYAAIKERLPAGWTASYTESLDPKHQAAALADAVVAFPVAAHMPASLLAAAPKLRFIQKIGAGVDRIDLDVCKARGIALANLGGGNAIPVAEHTLGLMLAVYRRLPQIDRRTRAGEWAKEEARGTTHHMHGKTIGLLGFGAIGKTVAKLLVGFGVTIVYYDPMGATPEVEKALDVRRVSLEELLKISDIVSLHLPLMTATRNILDEARLRSMKKGAVLINCARGGLVDEAALAKVLIEGHLFGAGVDAFENEPPVGSPLLDLDEVVISSHLAGATLDNFALVVEKAYANAERYLSGDGLPDSDSIYLPPK
jgi:D-3-phosphoglycerate dehydrogenase / 2-oxoglutarate reductase